MSAKLRFEAHVYNCSLHPLLGKMHEHVAVMVVVMVAFVDAISRPYGMIV